MPISIATNHCHGQFVSGHPVASEIGRHIHKHLVDAIDVDVLWRDIFQVNTVYLRADLYVVRHARRGCNIVNSPVWMLFKFYIRRGFACQTMPWHLALTFKVYLAHPLDYLEETCPSTDAILLQRRRHRQTDSFLCSAHVGHYEVCGQRVKPSVYTFNRCVERFEVDGNVCPLRALQTRPRASFR